jgi:hypothetical protein
MQGSEENSGGSPRVHSDILSQCKEFRENNECYGEIIYYVYVGKHRWALGKTFSRCEKHFMGVIKEEAQQISVEEAEARMVLEELLEKSVPCLSIWRHGTDELRSSLLHHRLD